MAPDTREMLLERRENLIRHDFYGLQGGRDGSGYTGTAVRDERKCDLL